MARLIFCFFAEDTDIFSGQGLFTDAVERMSAPDSSNTDEVIAEIFRAMNTENQQSGGWRYAPLGGCLPLREWRALLPVDVVVHATISHTSRRATVAIAPRERHGAQR